jgi:2,3-bisphosphoglycerate-independent phosphoglycerate mutase
MAARIHFDVIPGATGYIDTDYSAKASYAVNYVDKFDFVLVHINAADEEAHQHNHAGKITAIEKIDALVLDPLVRALRKKYSDNFRIAICGDHMTRCHDGKHADAPVPFVVYGKGIEPSGSNFSERSCASADPISSLKFIDQIRTA